MIFNLVCIIILNMVKVISLGGSIVAPEQIDIVFLKEFYSLIKKYLNEDKSRKIILVIGGGGPARSYQKAYREIADSPSSELQDWIGIAATRLNGELLKSIFSGYCKDPVVTDPSAVEEFRDQVLVASGWKPGFSTDFDAVVLAEKFNAKTVVNLSNISKVYSEDPKINPAAEPMDRMTWNEFRKLVGDEWIPGKNVPFDPIATKKAAELGMQIIVAGGRDIMNIDLILNDRLEEIEGTLIGPE